MVAAEVERPMTAEERVLTANDPPPRPPTQPDLSHRQRAAVNNRGMGVAGTFRGKADGNNNAAVPVKVVLSKRKGIQSSPSDFLAGPREPGHVTHGVRRYEEKHECMVGKALTEEWILGRKEDDPIPRRMVNQLGPKDNLEGMACSVRTEEAKQRRQRALGMAPPHSLAAPYSETEVPPPLQQPTPAVGKRRFKIKPNVNLFQGDAGAGQDADNKQTRVRVHTLRNRSNESFDVLNLGQYSVEDLHEVERKVLLGPRQFTPASLPPRQRPIIARVRTHANQTHDIFGTGKGVEDAAPVHRKNAGASAPKRSEAAAIFDYPEKQKPPKPYHPSGLLSYEEATTPNERKPSVSTAAAEAAAKERASTKLSKMTVQGQLFDSKSPDIAPHGGRCRGTYAPKTGGNNIF
ncbi:hypothetical protein TraAM80_02872 [Trypanosoma rangeli]|uniref:Flagellum targeting protein kharon1 n=1 Tax=Trypanosoma rangeli TaxID=5698 RepID=A0A3R7KIS2_TRYRA|nr:uncharacterized protein TraAM80_02872 [Trypanosoma rangeli]RNF08411.1 hypothetical protein TraAM80_02872 [Trypanosoma rangeli]|eukprot:RNF08411.1 hypothetical protein TraAM80_02872 [Trypanosoma rangeli]